MLVEREKVFHDPPITSSNGSLKYNNDRLHFFTILLPIGHRKGTGSQVVIRTLGTRDNEIHMSPSMHNPTQPLSRRFYPTEMGFFVPVILWEYFHLDIGCWYTWHIYRSYPGKINP